MIESKKNINVAMIIDDNEIDQVLYKRIIKRSNRIDNVICYSDAGEALEFLKRSDSEKIDVIFLDINMPRMNGFEFLATATAELGCAFAGAVVVMLTTSLAKEDQEHASQFNIVKAYLNKPLRIDDINYIADTIVHGSVGVSVVEQGKWNIASDAGQ